MNNKVTKVTLRAWLTLGLLTLLMALAFIDRMIISLLVEPIRADFSISDTQMSLLMGLSFVIFYTAFGIPVAKLADKYSRKLIIIASVFSWSLATVLSGFSKTYSTLFIARVGVGIGEGGFAPASYAFISDMFPRDKLAFATSIYSSGIALGIGFAYIVGGNLYSYFSKDYTPYFEVLESFEAWQLTFIAVGLPGFVFTLLLLLIREPARTGTSLPANADEQAARIVKKGLVSFILEKKKALGSLWLAMAAWAIVDFAFLSWIPTYYFRVRDVQLESAGTNIGIVYIIFATLGLLAGAKIAHMLQKRDHKDAVFKIGLVSAVVLVPLLWLMISLPTNQSFVAAAMIIMVFSLPWGVAPAALLDISPNHFRAQVTAIYLLIINLTGMTVGPTGVALLSDRFFKDEMQIGLALVVVGNFALFLAFVALWFGRKHYADAVAAMEVNDPA